jgi:hypothetical protein
MEELQSALEEAKNAELEADKLRAEAEKGKDKALEDLETLQKKTQFELVGRIVKIALIVIMGVGVITTAFICLYISNRSRKSNFRINLV